MITLDVFLTYAGALTIVLLFIYSSEKYLITLLAGYIAFCIYYFSFGIDDFEWTPASMLPHFKDAGIIYIISYAIGIIMYKFIPVKNTMNLS